MRPQDAGLRSVYSNAVEAPHFEDLKSHAVETLAFKHMATKQTASVHIKNMDLNTSLVVAFTRQGYVALPLRHMQSSQHQHVNSLCLITIKQFDGYCIAVMLFGQIVYACCIAPSLWQVQRALC